MKRIIALAITLFVLLSLSTSAASAASTASAGNSSPSISVPHIPNAYAYAAYAVVPTGTGNTTYGPSVPVGLSCTTPTTANTITNSGPALPTGLSAGSSTILPLGSLGSSGSATSTITINRTATSVTVQTSEDIHNLSMLGGLIAANNLHAIVTSTATATSATSTNTSQFSGMTIAGLPANNNPAPNTTTTLPGIGSVILNEQSGPSNGTNTTSIGVILMDIHLTLANQFFPVGTRILLAAAQSGILPSAVSASAFGFYSSGLGGAVPAVGPTASVGIGCRGGSSTNTANAFNSSTLGSTQGETSSASGQITSSGTSATAQNSTSNVNLLTGLISADKVITVANASWNGTGARSGSTTFVNAKVAGTPQANNPQPNTRENLPGIGYVVINEQSGNTSSSSAAESVIALDIYITVANNTLGLPVGARIVVSAASANAAD